MVNDQVLPVHAKTKQKHRAMTPATGREYREVLRVRELLLQGEMRLPPKAFITTVRSHLAIKRARERFDEKDPTMTDMDFRELCVEYTRNVFNALRQRKH